MALAWVWCKEDSPRTAHVQATLIYQSMLLSNKGKREIDRRLCTLCIKSSYNQWSLCSLITGLLEALNIG